VSCEARVRAAVKALPFVEPDSVRPSLSSRKVLFRLKKDQPFDLPAVRKALGDAGYDKVEVVTDPKG
jgi:hypothetical protein